MKVKANEDLISYLTKDKEYHVIKEEKDLYHIKNDYGINQAYFKHRFDVVNDSIFKVGDKLFYYGIGWLTVEDIENDMCFLYDEKNVEFCIHCDGLSFTEYTTTGFSQERPIELPELGEVCLVSDDEVRWLIKVYDGKGSMNFPFSIKGGENYKYCKRIKFA